LSAQIRDILKQGKAALAKAGVDGAERDAETLLCFVLGIERARLFLRGEREAGEELAEQYFEFVSRRASGEPLQYIIGEQDFFGRIFAVGEGVLVPRPETEVLASLALEYLKWRSDVSGVEASEKLSLLDLCTGSGILAITLALEFSALGRVVASDISKDALSYAKENAHSLGASNIEFAQGDLFEAINGKFDLIVCNPPYVRKDEIAGLQREIKDYEPYAALDGGEDGLDFYRRIAANARGYLNKSGALFLEIGADQGGDVQDIFTEKGFMQTTLLQDLAGRDRVLEVFA